MCENENESITSSQLVNWSAFNRVWGVLFLIGEQNSSSRPQNTYTSLEPLISIYVLWVFANWNSKMSFILFSSKLFVCNSNQISIPHRSAILPFGINYEKWKNYVVFFYCAVFDEMFETMPSTESIASRITVDDFSFTSSFWNFSGYNNTIRKRGNESLESLLSHYSNHFNWIYSSQRRSWRSKEWNRI